MQTLYTRYKKAIHLSTLVTIGLTATMLVIVCTSRYGVGISPDSVNYVGTARNLAAGNGYFTYNMTPYVSWPPLFPSLLGLVGLTGVDELTTARYLNAVLFGLITAMSGFYLLKRTHSFGLALTASILILLCEPMLQVCCFAWTEPMFALLVVLFLCKTDSLLAKPNLQQLLLSAGIVALACLTRERCPSWK